MIKVATRVTEANIERLRSATGYTEEDQMWQIRNAYSPDGEMPYMVATFDEERQQFETPATVSYTFFHKQFEPAPDRHDGGEINSDLSLESDWVEVIFKDREDLA